jgi:ketosteroid isomerase-like protein
MAVAAVWRLESMAVQRATDEASIRQRIHRWVEALRALDLEGVMSLYAPDIVSFDLVPPLRHVGAKAKEKNWANVFALYERPLGYEMRDLTLTLGDEVAFGHSYNRVSGRLKNGNETDFWVRWTACFGRSTATGSSRTTRSQCRSIRRAAERC